jgi:hypothetical protein
MELSSNQIYVSLPSEYSVWDNLKDLDLSSNRISQSLPSSWGAWTTVDNVDVSQNLLTNSIPDVWAKMKAVALKAKNNMLTLQPDDKSKFRIVDEVDHQYRISEYKATCALLDCLEGYADSNIPIRQLPLPHMDYHFEVSVGHIVVHYYLDILLACAAYALSVNAVGPFLPPSSKFFIPPFPSI